MVDISKTEILKKLDDIKSLKKSDQQIFKKLSNKNLAKRKKVARTWEHFIINEKFYKQKSL